MVISPRVEVERALEAGSEEPVIQGEAINLQISQLTYTTAGPNRFEISGRLEITGPLGKRSFELGEGSSLTVSNQTDPDGRYRIDALLISELEGVDNVEMRLAGFMETVGNEGRIAGLYGLSGEILEVEPKGSFAGMLVMTSESSNGVFTLTLGS